MWGPPMIVQGHLVVSVEPVPTRLAGDPNALCTLELNEDGHLVRVEARRLPPRSETPRERDAYELALTASRMLRTVGRIGDALDQARAEQREPELVDFLRQLAALEDLRGDEARARLRAATRRPGVM